VIDAARRAGQGWLTQEQAFAVLAAYRLDLLPTRTCKTPDAVGKAASDLGFPVVVKLLHQDFVTSRPEGSIAVDLPDAKSARAAASVIAARLRSRGKWPEGAEFIVQTQVRDARELRIRVADQPIIGPTISFGPGGVDPGDLSGLSVDLPPLNMALAQALIDRAGEAAILRVHRGLALADRTAVEAALVTVSQIIIDCPEISLLDIDPLFARQSGIAIGNVRIGLRPVGEERPKLAIRPYPDELVERVVLGGRRFTIRPIRPEDAEAHARLFARLPAEDIRRRFFSAIRALTPEQLVRMTEIDYTRELALIAVEAATGETVGVARLVCSDAEGTEGEFATLIEPGAKEIGLGSVLMRRLIGWAKREGVRRIVGQVLTENTPMLAFVRHLGFSVRHVPDEDDVVEASLELS